MLFSVDQAKQSLRLLGVPVNRENIRKCVRAKHLLDNGHMGFVKQWSTEQERVYHVASQWDDETIYTVSLNGVSHSCDCPDSVKSDICKHRITCLMHEYKQAHSNGHQHQEMVTFTASSVTGFETRNVSIWHQDRFYGVDAKQCQADGQMVTMPKVVADRHGIDYRFDPERPLYADNEKFDYAIFRHEADSYKLEMLQAMYR